jgi:tetratricopeptide (TPR) repeat protein
METGVFDQDRGLCYLAQGSADEGRGWLRRALIANHGNELARAQLVRAYFAQQDYAAVASLYKDAGITEAADPETYLQIANSLEKTGDVSGAISLAEAGIQSHPKDVPLYLGLADFYRHAGNVQKAEELIKLSKSYTPAS